MAQFTGTLAGGIGLLYNLAGSTVAAPSATMTYTGGTTLGGGGTFQTFADGNFGSTTSPAGIWLNDATLEVTGSGFSTNRAITLGAPSSTLRVDSGTLTVNTSIVASGGGA